MNKPLNPYAPPKSFDAGATGSISSAGLWRDNKDLITLQDARLPSRCVKCNAPGKVRSKPLKLWWHHSGFYALILLSPLIYIIAAYIARKGAEVSPALCEVHKKRRFNTILIGWVGAIACFVLWIATTGIDKFELSFLFFLGIFGFIIFGIFKARIVYAKKIDSVYVRMRGCGGEFLDSLPQFPG